MHSLTIAQKLLVLGLPTAVALIAVFLTGLKGSAEEHNSMTNGTTLAELRNQHSELDVQHEALRGWVLLALVDK